MLRRRKNIAVNKLLHKTLEGRVKLLFLHDNYVTPARAAAAKPSTPPARTSQWMATDQRICTAKATTASSAGQGAKPSGGHNTAKPRNAAKLSTTPTTA